MKVTVDMNGIPEFQRVIARVRENLRDQSPLYKIWGITTLKWIQENYRESGAKVGRWKPLSRLTVMGRRKASSKPLLDTGHMMRQWNTRLLSNGVEVGNPMEIARYHEEGTKPYTIKPTTAKVLHFAGKPGIFARIVHHPGLSARRQLPTEQEIAPELIKASEAWMRSKIK